MQLECAHGFRRKNHSRLDDRRSFRFRQGHDQPQRRRCTRLASAGFRRALPCRGFCRRHGRADLSDAEAVTRCAQTTKIGFRDPKDGSETRVIVNGLDATDDIRTETCGAAASAIAAIPSVRAALLDKQHSFRKGPGLVADGRDMGTVIFPDARFKVFLTASADERARRRYKQLKEKGLGVTLAALLREIQARDVRDAERPVAPLNRPPTPNSSIRPACRSNWWLRRCWPWCSRHARIVDSKQTGKIRTGHEVCPKVLSPCAMGNNNGADVYSCHNRWT